MADPSSAAGDGDSKDNSVAKTAGLVVFSGIALSILKALNPFNKKRNEETPLSESTQPIQLTSSQPQPPQQQPILKEPHPPLPKTITSMDQNVPDTPKSSHKTIEIEKGDTLWGLSREYGVSIDAIKEANGLTGDTIYAGKKLIIP
ncbi:PREDICTED: probable endopeptidase p60 isoform X2 [Prunus mume]|uniref:Probable endopeptidase p60 isoform X2 n=1 Tax=Prunus mume TaxID=102107 RepID=A0ABM1LPM6_PRUMU|nr:PREDICTED: probable endopeptidase p60 isoform X2 [Prunus mume]